MIFASIPAAAALLAAITYCEHRYTRTNDGTWTAWSFAALLCLVGLTVYVMAQLWGAKA